MVKTFEEMNENILDERKFNTFFAIFSRYVTEAYKQLKSQVSTSSGTYERPNDWTGHISFSDKNTGKSVCIIAVEYFYKDNVLECRLSYGNNQYRQTFPIDSVLPKKLGKLAQNIFKWVKEQMERI